MDDMSDAHEREKAELSQILIQQGRHDDEEEALKELKKRQQEEIDSKQSELDSELQATETKVRQMINEEQTNATVAAHRNTLEQVMSMP